MLCCLSKDVELSTEKQDVAANSISIYLHLILGRFYLVISYL